MPFPPGGPSDSIARVIAEQLRVALGQSVIVENRPGAGGNIGLGEAARAAPDGYTLAQIATSTFSVNPFVYNKLPYDPERDFVPVAVFARTANVLFVTPSLPAKSVTELVALAKARPGKLNAGFPGRAIRARSRWRCCARTRGSISPAFPIRATRRRSSH